MINLFFSIYLFYFLILTYLFLVYTKVSCRVYFIYMTEHFENNKATVKSARYQIATHTL